MALDGLNSPVPLTPSPWIAPGRIATRMRPLHCKQHEQRNAYTKHYPNADQDAHACLFGGTALLPLRPAQLSSRWQPVVWATTCRAGGGAWGDAAVGWW